MTTAKKGPIYLKDYTVPEFKILNVNLEVHLDDSQTVVVSTLKFNRNPDSKVKDADLILNGESLKLLGVKLNGQELHIDKYKVDEHSLTIFSLPEEFELQTTVEINPKENLALEGLYKSQNMFCTQNEPQGFRRITYYLDRPDVMSKFTTKIIASKKEYPVLLSNGNLIDAGDLENNKHFAVWEDPFYKPSYLYALVAGDLGMIEDFFVTCSNRKITLRIYCDKGNEYKCHHAMASLKKSMKWDEDRFGREYDLDIFMIVAADAFNMGAMENKGLNIFNSALLLADPKTATDANFDAIEAVIAHEYLHNWTGNRITCRDWFQLTLKEGLTVFRDQEFSADLHSRSVHRIHDVGMLRLRQLPEDSGPNAHPIRPEKYIEINNFYTATIYEKGAEVIRMLLTLVGKEKFRKGMDYYFKTFDGMAVTTEDFIHSIEVGAEIDLTHFKLWYSTAGTPLVLVEKKYDALSKECEIIVTQKATTKVKEEDFKPLYFPFKIGFLNEKGDDFNLGIKDDLLIVSKKRESFIFKNISSDPILSLNRDFSAPIKIEYQESDRDLIVKMGHDTNSFNRYDAAQNYALKLILKIKNALASNSTLPDLKDYLEAYGAILHDSKIDDSFKALCLGLPSDIMIMQEEDIVDFTLNARAIERLKKAIYERFKNDFLNIYEKLSVKKEYSLNAKDIGQRALKAVVLSRLNAADDREMVELAKKQFLTANNMTDELNALSILCSSSHEAREQALTIFYEKFKNDILVMQKWMAVQTAASHPDIIKITKDLLVHPAYDENIPNFLRSVLRGFSQNLEHFHNPSGQGYELLATEIIKIDKKNPLMASALSTAFNAYQKLMPQNKELMKRELNRILNMPGISKNTYEIISKTLG